VPATRKANSFASTRVLNDRYTSDEAQLHLPLQLQCAMAVDHAHSQFSSPPADNKSDYGSDLDLDDDAFTTILTTAESQLLSAKPLIDIEDVPFEHEPPQQGIHLRLSQLQQSLGAVRQSKEKIENLIRTREASVEVEYDELNRGSFSRAYLYTMVLWEEADVLTM